MSNMLPPQAAPPSPGGPTQGGDQAIPLLEKAAALIAQFVQVEQDPQEKALGAKLLAQCHAIVGSRDKERESAMGISPQLKFVKRMAAQNQGQQSGGGDGGY